ncbi:MAG: glycosyltransferase family 2 protein [Bacteroidota bacterium]
MPKSAALSHLVSILVPFKNTAAFFTACLESILEQSYGHFEVIAVDDHSLDGSLHIATEYAQKDNRIQVYPNRGQGIIPALRTAHANCTGILVTRMDADDIMMPNRLEVMVNALTKKGLGHLAVGQVRYFSDIGIGNGYKRYEKWLNGLTAKGTNYTEIYKECVVPSPCWMAYRDDLQKCGAFDPDQYPEDYDLAFRFYEHQLKVIPCAQVLHLWRDHATRSSRTQENYAQNYFLDIKLHYFLRLDYHPKQTLVVWGAGFKGKCIAKRLWERGIDFDWVCDNPNKIGKKIYGKPMAHFSSLASLQQPQSIITVANTIAQQYIKGYLYRLGHRPMKDFFFFC